jgi:hypothetical protein
LFFMDVPGLSKSEIQVLSTCLKSQCDIWSHRQVLFVRITVWTTVIYCHTVILTYML